VLKEVLASRHVHLNLERLIDLVEELLFESLILDQLTDSCQTLGYLIRWKSAHEIKDGVSHNSFIVLVG